MGEERDTDRARARERERECVCMCAKEGGVVTYHVSGQVSILYDSMHPLAALKLCAHFDYMRMVQRGGWLSNWHEFKPPARVRPTHALPVRGVCCLRYVLYSSGLNASRINKEKRVERTQLAEMLGPNLQNPHWMPYPSNPE